MTIDPEAPRGHGWGWTALRRILRLKVSILFRLGGFEVGGRERLRAAVASDGPLMIVSNHAAFVDSVYFIVAVPARITVCGAKPRLFSTPFRRALMALANVIEVESREGFLRGCGRLLAAGETVLVYPEMGRRPTGLDRFETWAADAALAVESPVLPCYVYGTTEGHTGPRRLVVGETLIPSGDPESFTATMREAIVALEQTTR